MRQLTFSQSQGIEPLPKPLGLGEISQWVRHRLWDVVWKTTDDMLGQALGPPFWVFLPPWDEIFAMLHRDYWERPTDNLKSAREELEHYRKFFLTASLNSCFDVLQMIMQHPACPGEFVTEIQDVFQECQLAYRVDATTSTPVILPVASKEEGDALIRALRDLEGTGLGGAAKHLREAGERIIGQDWPGSVQASIHAVESVAKQIAPGDADTLGTAIAALERQKGLHSALKRGFGALYGYTSDEPGIRHALLDDESQVTADEAIFMIGACAAFCSYLWRKFGSENDSSRTDPTP